MGITEVIKGLHHHIPAAVVARLLFTPLELQEEDTGKVEVIITDPEIIMDQRVFLDHPKPTMEEEARGVAAAGIDRTEVVIEDQRIEVVVLRCSP